MVRPEDGRRSRGRSRETVVSVLLAVAVPVVFILAEDFLKQHSKSALASVALVLGCAALWLVHTRERAAALDPPTREQLDEIADKLRSAVKTQWNNERTVRRLPDEEHAGRRLPLQWTLQRAPGTPGPPLHAAAGARRSGESIAELAELMREVLSHRGRLVIVGEAESGKSAAAVLLALDLLRHRPAAREEHPGRPWPVPFLCPAGAWPQELDVRSWVEKRLAADHLWLDTGSVPGLLLDAGFVLPVIDGLNEIRPDTRLPGLTAEIMSWPGNPLPGMLMTCTTEIFTTDEGQRWCDDDAAVVMLEPLPPDSAGAYLCEYGDSRQRDRWKGVLERLREAPRGPLAAALSSRLMVSLAAAIYEDGSTDPSELLRSGDTGDIRTRLFEAFIPAVFLERTTRSRPGGRWPRDGAQARLAFLAYHMDRLNIDELGWWELSKVARRPISSMAGVLGAASTALAVGLAVRILVSPAAGLIAGAVSGIVMGVVCARNDAPMPSDIQIQLRNRTWQALASGLGIGAVAFAAGVVARDVTLGLLLMFAFGVPFAILYGLTSRDATPWAVTPEKLLRRDLRVAYAYGVAYSIPTAIIGGVLAGDVASGLEVGLACGALGGAFYGPFWVLAMQGGRAGAAAWLHFSLARAWLAFTNRLPWDVMAFLEDAHRLGVLRRPAGKYAFRDAQLRHALARQHRGKRM